MHVIRRTWKWALIAVGAGLAGAIVWVALTANYGFVTTPSMYPTIPPGSMVFIRRQPSYHVGQVIEFRGNGLDYVHRIIKIAPDGDITTKGDNPENVPDVFVPATTKADVIGAVYFAPKWIGFPELIARHPAYGLAWLRAELGPVREGVLVALIGIVSFLGAGGLTRRKEPEEPLPGIQLSPAPGTTS